MGPHCLRKCYIAYVGGSEESRFRFRVTRDVCKARHRN